MKHPRSKLLLAFVLVVLASPLLAQTKGRIITVGHVLGEMERKLQNIKDFKADYVIENDDYQDTGQIFYKRPFFLRMISKQGKGFIISNGKTLWIYLPKHGVVAQQELLKSEKQHQLMLATSKKSLRHLRRDYSFKFAPNGRANPEFYIMDLQPRVTKIGFKEMRIWIDKKHGLITRIKAETVNKRKVSIRLSNIAYKHDIKETMFWFGMPDGNVQVIKNTILPLDSIRDRR